MIRRRGFATSIIAGLIVGFLIPLMGGLGFSMFYERSRAEEDLSLRHERILNILVRSLKDPMLTFSPEGASRAVRMLMQDEAVAAVRVYSVVFDMDLANFTRPEFPPESLQTVRRHILSGGEVLGFVEVSMSAAPMEEALEVRRERILLLFTTMLVFGLVITLPIVWYRGLIPLNRLADEAKRLSEGDLDRPIVWSGADEFALLGSTMEQMRASLHASFNEIEAMASTDELTGIANRRKFRENAEREVELARRYGTTLSIVLFDIDHFKFVNDEYGHNVGDIILKELAAITQAQLRTVDLLARWGGEEFVLLLPETTQGGGVAVAEKLRRAIYEYQFSVVGRVTCSFGVSAFWGADSLLTLLERADSALYKAKQNGRNRVEQS